MVKCTYSKASSWVTSWAWLERWTSWSWLNIVWRSNVIWLFAHAKEDPFVVKVVFVLNRICPAHNFVLAKHYTSVTMWLNTGQISKMTMRKHARVLFFKQIIETTVFVWFPEYLHMRLTRSNALSKHPIW
jgi:hypothetical protein